MATAAELLTRVKARAGWPETGGPLSDAELLEFFDSEIKAVLQPQLHKAQGDWHLTDQDYTLDGRALYRLPSKMWGPVKDVGFVIDGDFVGADMINVETLGQLGRDARPNHARLPGFVYLKGDFVGVHPVNTTGTLRVIYYREPHKLTLDYSTIIDAGTFDPQQIWVDPPQTEWGTVNVIAAGGAHQWLGDYVIDSVLGLGVQLLLSVEVPNTIEVGDLVAPRGYTPVAQIPDHLEPQLLQRVAMLMNNSNGDDKAFARAAVLAKDLEARALPTISPRQEAAPVFIRPQRGLYRGR